VCCWFRLYFLLSAQVRSFSLASFFGSLFHLYFLPAHSTAWISFLLVCWCERSVWAWCQFFFGSCPSQVLATGVRSLHPVFGRWAEFLVAHRCPDPVLFFDSVPSLDWFCHLISLQPKIFPGDVFSLFYFALKSLSLRGAPTAYLWALAVRSYTRSSVLGARVSLGNFSPALISLPRCRVRSSSISSVSATPVCLSRPSLLASDFPLRRGRVQVHPRARTACPSSSFLRPCQVFASTSRFRVGVALCLICLPADLMCLLLQCVRWKASHFYAIFRHDLVDYSSHCLMKCVWESVKFVDLILVVVVSLVTSTCIELYFSYISLVILFLTQLWGLIALL
jgi:hypothetical protein